MVHGVVMLVLFLAVLAALNGIGDAPTLAVAAGVAMLGVVLVARWAGLDGASAPYARWLRLAPSWAGRATAELRGCAFVIRRALAADAPLNPQLVLARLRRPDDAELLAAAVSRNPSYLALAVTPGQALVHVLEEARDDAAAIAALEASLEAGAR